MYNTSITKSNYTRLLKDLDKDMDAEMVRVVETSPKWSSGKSADGVAVLVLNKKNTGISAGAFPCSPKQRNIELMERVR